MSTTDCISRARLISELKLIPDAMYSPDYAKGWKAAMDEVLEIVANFPTLYEKDVEEPVIYGRWEICRLSDNLHGCQCSNCGNTVGFEAINYKYCPYCGATMLDDELGDELER